MAVRADFAVRGFAISSLMPRRVALAASLSEFLLDMPDDGTLPDPGTVNLVHTGWNTCGYGCSRQNRSRRASGSLQGGEIATACLLINQPTDVGCTCHVAQGNDAGGRSRAAAQQQRRGGLTQSALKSGENATSALVQDWGRCTVLRFLQKIRSSQQHMVATAASASD